MNPVISMVLWALLAFQVKHFLCDFALQTQRQILKKGVYGHPSGLSHAALHGLASLPALFILTSNGAAIGWMVALEFVVHYHGDWAKAQIDTRFRLTTTHNTYWIVFGIDQMVHQLTYVAMIFILFYEGWTRLS